MNVILRSISFMVLLSIETLASSSRFSHQKCGLYGMPPCNYVPSTSGVTPVCASPGKTYCEFVQNYPVHTIRLLLDKWGIDNVNDLIVDETVDDFEATRRFNDIPLFDQKPPDPNQTPTFNDLPNAVPTDGFHHFDGGYNYPNPNKMHTAVPQPQPPPSHPSPSLPSPASKPGGYLPTNGYTVNHNPSADRYWSGFSYSINQRYVRDVSLRTRFARQIPSNSSIEATLPTPANHAQRSSSHQNELAGLNDRQTNSTDSQQTNRRPKRQSAGREQLCQTTYQYITPQAALNSQGNWMYIVNQVDTTRQLVRTETCASTVCSNICQLPNGYSSRCEQKYVQKRLIALNADGTNLYTDTFWFPSCCQCTIAGST
ncbi:protein spaetzle 5 isoform X2 [Sitodiplosis mosellana]|uniref:protein spaetzle 5 isoform X2 n=1 Tax=Sitodiplosis mosellana TaxID=263140 RepID=UPI0024449909|nr:protein spaetzle 5 isoform X2 [Sitodiplosis mosellana]XP_055318361.1 protein spaetzle 5 isoform X2 [Sitodiplosis mosellana]